MAGRLKRGRDTKEAAANDAKAHAAVAAVLATLSKPIAACAGMEDAMLELAPSPKRPLQGT